MRAPWSIHSFESLGSTQDKAKEYLAEGSTPLPFVIQADVQSAGRGRSGNNWISPQGNLYATFVTRIPRILLRDVGQYSFLAAVALMDVLADRGVAGAVNKWPNDILVNGKKIAGILLESDGQDSGMVDTLFIGVGVNLAVAPDGAVALSELTGTKIAPLEFLNKFVPMLHSYLDEIGQSGFAGIRQKWLDKAYGIGTDIRVRLPREAFHGIFRGLDDDGALLVQVQGDVAPRRIYSGDVFFDKKDNG